MEQLQSFKMLQTIPDKFVLVAPRIESLVFEAEDIGILIPKATENGVPVYEGIVLHKLNICGVFHMENLSHSKRGDQLQDKRSGSKFTA